MPLCCLNSLSNPSVLHAGWSFVSTALVLQRRCLWLHAPVHPTPFPRFSFRCSRIARNRFRAPPLLSPTPLLHVLHLSPPPRLLSQFVRWADRGASAAIRTLTLNSLWQGRVSFSRRNKAGIELASARIDARMDTGNSKKPLPRNVQSLPLSPQVPPRRVAPNPSLVKSDVAPLDADVSLYCLFS